MIHFIRGKQKGDLYQRNRLLYQVKYAIGPIVISRRTSWYAHRDLKKEINDIFDYWNYR